MNKRDFLNVYKAIDEILCIEQKKELNGNTIYGLAQCFVKLASVNDEITKAVKDLNEPFQKALEVASEKEKVDIQKDFETKVEALLDETLEDIEFYKLPKDSFNAISKFLTGRSTVAIFKFMLKE